MEEYSQIPAGFGILNPDDAKERNRFVKFVKKDGKLIKVWVCATCTKEFGHQYTLMRHLPTHTDERKYQCNICGKAFRQMSTLSQHRAIHSTDRPYMCEICRKTFNRVSTLISHRKTHTGHKPHACHLCSKAFHQKGNLRNHIFTHTNERPYKCDVCGKGFNQMSNLMCHKIKAHQRSDRPRYSCQVCGKDFPKRNALRNHEQYQHGMCEQATASTPSTSRVLAAPPALEQRPELGKNEPDKFPKGVLVDPITTDAMKLAISTSQTPFALLRPLNGIPVLVRVLNAGEKQMLVPATADDLRKHGHITVHNQAAEVPVTGEGSTVQIKIPVVASVVERRANDGTMSMSIESPPGPQKMDNLFEAQEETAALPEDMQFSPGTFQEAASSQAYMDHSGLGFVEASARVVTSSQSFVEPQFLDGSRGIMTQATSQAFMESSSSVNNQSFLGGDPLLLSHGMEEMKYYDEYGNVISKEEYNARTELLEFETLPSTSFTFLPANSIEQMPASNLGDSGGVDGIRPLDCGNSSMQPGNTAVKIEDNMNQTFAFGNEAMFGVGGSLETIDQLMNVDERDLEGGSLDSIMPLMEEMGALPPLLYPQGRGSADSPVWAIEDA